VAISASPRLCGETLLIRNDGSVRIGAAVAEELPGVADLADLVHVEIGDYELILVTRPDSEHLTTRIAEIALAVELADIPWSFGADTIDRSDEITVSDGMCGLFELPEIFAQSGDRGRRIEYDLCSVQTKAAGSFGKVAVVANIDADPRIRGIETRVT